MRSYEDVVVVKGAGDIATGVAYRLHRSGYAVVMTEIAAPTVVRRTVAFAQAIFDGLTVVEDVVARRVATDHDALALAHAGDIAVLVDPAARCVRSLRPVALVDAIIAKRNLGTRLTDAPLVVALGPGFEAGVDAHVVVETNRGHRLGRVILHGAAEPDTGVPAPVDGHGAERVLRAPVDGVFVARREIGEQARAGDVLAVVGDEEIACPFDGYVRGLLQTGLVVRRGLKVGDVDPRATREHCFTISDKALAIGGGVLEALLSSTARRTSDLVAV